MADISLRAWIYERDMPMTSSPKLPSPLIPENVFVAWLVLIFHME